MAPGKPEGHLLKEIRILEAGKMGAWPLREQLDRMYQTYLALCRRTRNVPVIIEQNMVEIYFRYLPEDLGAQVRDLAPDGDLETRYAAAKFAAAREDRRTTHPLLWDVRGLSAVSGEVTGPFAIPGESAESRDPAFAAREPRSSAIPATMEVHRSGGSFNEEGDRPPVPDRRREGFPERHARPMMAASRASPRPYVARSRFGFKDVPGRNQGPPIPRSRAAERR